VIFYAVPESNPLAPPTCFVDRWWDYKEGYLREGVGTDNKWTIYKGPLPAIPVKQAEGRKEWWTHGMSYELYLAGGYSNSGPCMAIPPTSVVPICPGRAIGSATVERIWSSSPVCPGRAIGSAVVEIDWDDFPVLAGKAIGTGEGINSFAVECPGRATLFQEPSVFRVECPGRAIGSATT